MAAHSPLGTDGTVEVPRDQLTFATKQWVMQLDRQRIAELQKVINERHFVLNSQHSAFLKLPVELLIEIGQFVLNATTSGCWHDKAWFKKVLPLLQTRKHLRSALRPLRSELLVCTVQCFMFDEIWSETLLDLEKWHMNSPHNGPVSISVKIGVDWDWKQRKELLAIAAMAAALECHIYGGLQHPPAVYIEHNAVGWIDTPCRNVLLHHRYFINHTTNHFTKKEVTSEYEHPACGLQDLSDAEGITALADADSDD